MNLSYEDNLEKNFNRALTLCSSNFSRDELFEFLKNGNIPEKQFAALEINSLENDEETSIFMNNLTGCDGKIREAVAYKLHELVKKTPEYFLKYPEIFANATIDINANVSRMVIESLIYLRFDKDFAQKYINKILLFTNEALDKLDSFIFRDKKYTINKQLFKLYWSLESINVFYSCLDETVLLPILKICSQVDEYTIRERVALILKNDIKSDDLKLLKSNLKSDSNYYVKNV